VSDELDSFAEDLRQEILSRADIEGVEQLRGDVFAEYILDLLIEAGEIENAQATQHRARGIEVHGWGIDDEDTLNLLAVHYTARVPPGSLTPTDAGTAFRRMRALWERCRDAPYHERLEPSSPAYDMAEAIHRAAADIRRVRMFVATDARSLAPQLHVTDDDGVEYRSNVWDIVRLQRLESAGRDREPIEVDFVERFGTALPCLGGEQSTDDYSAMVAIIPGQWLAEIYEDHGARLLELNVRAFLQASGKVNRGIRDTLRNEPERFLAYNNGISATAGSVTLVPMPDGGNGIASIRDLQIVNGGQTTASVHRAMLARIDLSGVSVQAKLTVAGPGRLAEIVPLISRYANSQNRVSEADLSANEPFHVEIEHLSRTVWTPVVDGATRQTHWFYERARGQYRDAVFRAGTPAQQREFKAQNPPEHRFSKTDLAKYEQAWDQLPHEVSRGAQKNFTLYMANRARRHSEADRDHFQALIAKALVWKRTEKIVSAEKFLGYRANLVAYAIAKLSHATGQRLDLPGIWMRQALTRNTEDAIRELSHLAWHAIVEDAPRGVNVGEWAKREDCWRALRARQWAPPGELSAELVVATSEGAGGLVGADLDDATAQVNAIGVDGWLALQEWAKQTANLHGWQRTTAGDIARRIAAGRRPSARQVEHGHVILREAAALGFTP
jgi:AIPR protein